MEPQRRTVKKGRLVRLLMFLSLLALSLPASASALGLDPLPLPAVTTSGAVPTGATKETVNGTVNPSGRATSYFVEYGLASSDWCTSHGLSGPADSSTAPQLLGPQDVSAHAVTVSLSSLTTNSAYCAEIIAS